MNSQAPFKKTSIAKYALLPGLIPRIFALFSSGFGHVAYYIALVYAMVRLIPADHPYLNPQNFGKFGIRHVIAQAAENIEFSWKNADKIIIFTTVIIGLILIIMQFLLLGLALIASQPAMASFSVNALFSNPGVSGSLGPSQDIAFILLDKVFGMQGIFESCVSTAAACENTRGVAIPGANVQYPYPMHLALHDMFQFYSMGILFIAAWVLIYFVITIVAETSMTGTPFGRRFNKGWVPIRIVVFFGLLIPLGGTHAGMNGAQIITFWVAKHGSNFATNGWAHFNSSLTTTYLGEQQSLIAEPNPPELNTINQFILTAKTCVFAEEFHAQTSRSNQNPIRPYIVRPSPPTYASAAPLGTTSHPDAMEFMGATFTQARNFSLGGNMTLRIGRTGRDTNGDGVINEFNQYSGNVEPTCGEILIPASNIVEPGAVYIAEEYFKMLQEMWQASDTLDVATCLVEEGMNINLNHDPDCTDLPNKDYAKTQNETYRKKIKEIIADGVNEQRGNGDFSVPTEVLEKGWGGAAIWFNRVAQMNGAVTSAAFNLPAPIKLADVLEQAMKKRARQSQNVSGTNRYSLNLPNGEILELGDRREIVHVPVYNAYMFWGEANQSVTPQTGNFVIDSINYLLGTHGIFTMRKNADIHPLAQLTALGKGMIDAVVRNAGFALAGAGVSGLLGLIDALPQELAKIGSGFFFSMVTVSIGIAVILFFILPLIPFIYFFFAISSWLKSIFEAIVAMPLWALSHLRIDGDGLPGPAASNGYFLLLEIFIRPILILFGLLASINIFSALVFTLNTIFDQVVNVGGFDHETAKANATMLENLTSSIDEFFFTAMYAIICYILGLACFKLIDQIPNQILRWAGASVATFQEQAGDPAGQLTNNVYKGSLLISNQVRGATQSDLAVIANLS